MKPEGKAQKNGAGVLLIQGSFMMLLGFVVLFDGRTRTTNPTALNHLHLPVSMALIFGGGGLIQAAMSLRAVQKTIRELRDRIVKLETAGKPDQTA